MELVDLISFAVVGALLAGIGKGINGMVFPGNMPKAGWPGWRGLFYRTMWAHPVIIGALLGLAPWLPAPEAMGSSHAGRVLWYALSGLLSSTLYDAIQSHIKHKFAVEERKAGTLPPPGDDTVE